MLPKEIQEAIDALPGKIKVRVEEAGYGALHVYPVDKEIEKLIGITNEYDGKGDLYIQQDSAVRDFLESHPQARLRIARNTFEMFGGHHIGKYYYEVNDGAEFYMDSWEFRHMVGGQSD